MTTTPSRKTVPLFPVGPNTPGIASAQVISHLPQTPLTTRQGTTVITDNGVQQWQIQLEYRRRLYSTLRPLLGFVQAHADLAPFDLVLPGESTFAAATDLAVRVANPAPAGSHEVRLRVSGNDGRPDCSGRYLRFTDHAKVYVITAQQPAADGLRCSLFPRLVTTVTASEAVHLASVAFHVRLRQSDIHWRTHPGSPLADLQLDLMEAL